MITASSASNALLDAELRVVHAYQPAQSHGFWVKRDPNSVFLIFKCRRNEAQSARLSEPAKGALW